MAAFLKTPCKTNTPVTVDYRGNDWKRRNTIHDLTTLAEEYDKILTAYQATSSVSKACRAVGVCRRNFYKNRYISELRIVDRGVFERLLRVSIDSTSISAFNNVCKLKLLEHGRCFMVHDLRRQGKLIP